MKMLASNEHSEDDLSSMTTNATDETFKFGSRSIFGRRHEFCELTDSFFRVKKNKGFETCKIHGEPGVGKTSLVMKLQEIVLANDGFFCSGRYFPNSMDLTQNPYSAITAAFSDLCDIMLQSTDFNEERRKEIERELGADGKLLINVVTNISPFLRTNSKYNNYSNAMYEACSFARLRTACKSFLRAMSTNEHCVVLFIDDIQWMDIGSRYLLQSLLEDKQIKNVMLILAHRDGEIYRVEDLFPSHINYDIDIYLENLEVEHVRNMIFSRLKIPPTNELLALTELIFRKTHGNPFHVVQFLDTIKAEGFLTYDETSLRWVCDVDIIQKETMIPDFLAVLISRKVNRLSTETKEVLKLASLLRPGFSEDIIVELSQQLIGYDNLDDSLSTVHSLLQTALDNQILEKTCDGYQFSHEQLRSAFQGIIEKREKERLNVMIGLKYLSKPGDFFKYLAARHLNGSINHLVDTTENRVMVARTNYEASRYCRSIYAYSSTADFLRKGFSLLDGPEKWTTYFDLAFEMTQSLAMLEYILGNMEACIRTNEGLFHIAKSHSAKINCLFLDINARMVDSDPSEAASAGRTVLHRLDYSIPSRITPIHPLLKLKKIRKLLDSKTDEEILSFTQVDQESSLKMKVMFSVIFFLGTRQKYLLAVYTMLSSIETSLTKGLSPYTASTFSVLGIGELILGNRNRAYRLGKLAEKLSQMIPSENSFLVLSWVALFFLHTKERLKHEYFSFTPIVLNDALTHGNTVSAFHAGMTCFFARLWTGEHLESLENSIRPVNNRLIEIGQEDFGIHFKPILQLVLNLARGTPIGKDPTILTGEVMNEEEYIQLIESSTFADNGFATRFWFCKMVLAYYFGSYELAEKCSDIIRGHNRGLKWTFHKDSFFSLPSNFYSAMIYSMRYRETSRTKYLRKSRNCQKFLERSHLAGNPNAAPYFRLAKAEEISIKSKDATQVRAAYDEAIEIHSQEGLFHLEALAYERASFACTGINRAQGDTIDHLKVAMQTYKSKWGALGKHEWMVTQLDVPEEEISDSEGSIDG